MIRSGKRPLTVGALEGLDTRVLPHVAGELVGACKLPIAALPATFVRFLPGVGALVSLEVGALGVDLVAARVETLIYLLILLGWLR